MASKAPCPEILPALGVKLLLGLFLSSLLPCSSLVLFLGHPMVDLLPAAYEMEDIGSLPHGYKPKAEE